MRTIWVYEVVVALAVLGSGCAKNAQATQPPAEPVDTAPRKVVLEPDTVKRLGIKSSKAGDPAALPTIGVPGSVEYDLERYAEVGPRLDGRIVSVKAKLGDAVKKGAVLAELAVPTLAEAQASQLVANATLIAAKKNADREKGLLEKNLTTAREAEVAETDLLKATADAAAAKARLDALGASGGGIGGTIRLLAPIDGTVVQRLAVIGGHLAASANAFVVADTSHVIAALEVNEADLTYLKLGADVSFTSDAIPGRNFKGKLTYIDPTIGKATRLVRARVEVENADGVLRPGMFVRAAISLDAGATKGTIALPPHAVQPLGNDDVVFVEGFFGVYEIRVVTIARRTSDVVEISSGLKAGENVVTDGAFLLRGEAARR
ncbi:MAG: efflux RND transporter periplasmic adaptor subunit [Polyangiales bacterium]